MVAALLAATGGLTVGGWVIAAAPAFASTLTTYAAPADVGLGDCLTAATACDLQQALDNTSSGGTVNLEGDHGDYTSSVQVTQNVTLQAYSASVLTPTIVGTAASVAAIDLTADFSLSVIGLNFTVDGTTGSDIGILNEDEGTVIVQACDFTVTTPEVAGDADSAIENASDGDLEVRNSTIDATDIGLSSAFGIDNVKSGHVSLVASKVSATVSGDAAQSGFAVGVEGQFKGDGDIDSVASSFDASDSNSDTSDPATQSFAYGIDQEGGALTVTGGDVTVTTAGSAQHNSATGIQVDNTDQAAQVSGVMFTVTDTTGGNADADGKATGIRNCEDGCDANESLEVADSTFTVGVAPVAGGDSGADATGIATFGESATVHHSTFALDISASGDSGNSNATGVESGALGGSLDVTNSKFTGTTDVPGSDLESIDCEQDAASCSVATTHMSVTAETETGSTADDTEAIATDITSDAGFLTVSKSQLSADALEVPLDPGANLAGAIFITANGAVSHSTLLASGAATGLEVDGISTVSPADSPVVSMTDSTVVGDSSSSTGIAVNEYIDNTNTGALTPAVLTVEQSTITSVAGGPAGVGIFVDDQGTANLGADILAANDDNCELGGTGSYVDEGYDIDSDTTCTSAPTSVSGSTTIAGSLTPLANNGGPTETVGLKAGSPAIGLVSGTFHLTTDASQACANDDQRGHARAASGCDAGAFEGTVSPSGSGSGSGAQTPTVTVTSSDPTSADGQPVTYTATISPAPSCGSVAWLVDGVAQGTAVAVSSGTVGPDGLTITFGPVSDLDVGTHPVTAAYSGCAGISQAAGTVVQVVGEGSTTGTSGTGPTITAKVTSKHHKTKAGWYRDPVTVTFTCTPAAAPLAAPGCPPPVTLKNSAAGQSVTGSVTATDGGIATVTVSPINIDRTPPTGLRLHGATAGHRYSFAHRHRQLTCSAHDSLSGVRSCTVSRTHVTHVHVVVVHYTLTATNKAGDTTKATGTYRYSRNA